MDPEADAEIIHWIVDVQDWVSQKGLVSDRRHQVRVKVFTRKGAQRWSRLEFDQLAWSTVRISDIEARTVLADGTVRELAPGALSEESLVRTRRAGWKRFTCALSGVEPGAIVEYRYTERWTGVSAMVGFYPLQCDVPSQKILYKVRSVWVRGLAVRLLAFHLERPPPRAPVGAVQVIHAANQPAFVAEPDMPPRMQQLPFVLLFYSEIGQFGPEAYWPGVSREHAQAFDEATLPDEAIRQAAQAVTNGVSPDVRRVEQIARWLHDHFRIVRSDSPDSLKALGLRRTKNAGMAFRQQGGCREDALLVFASLLRAAGFQAREVLAPSRSEMFFHRNMTLEHLLGTRQVAVRLDGRWTCFDPTTDYLPWDMLDWDTEGTTALLCDRDSTQFVETPLAPAERSIRTRQVSLELDEAGSLAGTLDLSFSGHFNAHMRTLLAGLHGTELDSTLSRLDDPEGTSWEVSEARLLNGGDFRQPLRLTARLRLPDYATVTGKRMLLEPSVFNSHVPSRYTSTRRRHPIYYEHAWCELDTVRIRIPEGWALEDFDAVSPRYADGVADYVAGASVSADGREFLYVRRFRMGIDGSIYILPEYYPGVRQFFDDVRQRDGVVLSLRRAAEAP